MSRTTKVLLFLLLVDQSFLNRASEDGKAERKGRFLGLLGLLSDFDSSEEDVEKTNSVYESEPKGFPKFAIIHPSGQVVFYSLPESISNINVHNTLFTSHKDPHHLGSVHSETHTSPALMTVLRRGRREAEVTTASGSSEETPETSTAEPLGFLSPPTTAPLPLQEASSLFGVGAQSSYHGRPSYEDTYFTTPFPYISYPPYGKFCPSKVDFYQEMVENGFYPVWKPKPSYWHYKAN